MRSHTKNFHEMSDREYMKKYGNYHTQLAREVYHRCGLCQEELLLDEDEIHKHIIWHKMMMKDYTTKFLNSNKTNTKQEEIVPKERGVWDIIQDIENILDSFSRNFG